LSESIYPWVYSLQFLLKSTNNSWKYERKCEWVFFSEHSVVKQHVIGALTCTASCRPVMIRVQYIQQSLQMCTTMLYDFVFVTRLLVQSYCCSCTC